ncbi:MAG: aliphatic sulfonate ABC transporter substrate-binding protein [Thaumarchaeota archaeon]|nr:aliphatic sulfonate ABC transporter substrate-binding protein [Nitrososphaerota archaeon]MDE1817543.1 aliphatic sulfonate ABC transporter substrate-binding protein [Nitrososphaerota archaeon]MDE1876094.1 aliphatic sulfonate ABC transporter substrate-binding protein [Nitrososphaerota archaeon]
MNAGIKFGIAGAIIGVVIILSLISHPLLVSSQSSSETTGEVLRIGYFLNMNHAQAVIGVGNGDFQNVLGNVKIESQVFNAGPDEVEALFTNRIDIAYVGPNPVINGYLKSDGGLKIIAGVSSGGAVFVIRNDSGIETIHDFAGKKFASPQLGNTQDVALRSYLIKNGYKTSENGGNVTILPAKTSDIVTMMSKKDIDGAWVPEPWGATLVKNTGGKIFLDERNLWPNGKFTTALIVTRTDYLQSHPDIIQKLLEAHVKETIWINNNKNEAIDDFNTQLQKLADKTIQNDVLSNAFSRMDVTYDPVKSSVITSADSAFDLGFLGDKKPDLSNIFDLTILNKVLQEQNLPVIP